MNYNLTKELSLQCLCLYNMAEDPKDIEERPDRERFKITHVPKLMVTTFKAWNADNPWRLSASVAYYAILSLPALLVVIVNAVGAIWGVEIVQGHLAGEFEQMIGADSAEAIENMIADSMNADKSLIASIIGVATILFGATGVFYQLQQTLNDIWQIQVDPDMGIKKFVIDRVRSFGFILIMGFLLLISFVLTAGIGFLNDYLMNAFPDIFVVLGVFFDIVISLIVITLLFAMMFRYLPDVKIQWRAVWVGAFITACLFILGKYLLSLYFSFSNPGSTYGAAGSMILMLLWVSYSCLILFFGAEFTFVYAQRYGYGIEPSEHANRVKITTEIIGEKVQSRSNEGKKSS